MADEIVPQAGDVWELDRQKLFITGNNGLHVFYVCVWPCHNEKAINLEDWFATAKRVFPPSQPAAPGDVIPVECAVFCHDDNSLMVEGRSYCTADETEENRPDQRCVATVTVNVPQSLLSPAVLPDVTASE